MAFCSKCGAPLDTNSVFCSSCGTAIATTSQSGSNQPQGSSSPPSWDTPPTVTPSSYGGSQATTTGQRPTGVTILAILSILGGVVGVVVALGAGALLASLGAGGIAAGLSIVVGLFALLDFAVAYAFWTGATWGWWFGMIVAVLNIISIFSLDIFGLIIGIIMLYYLTRPHVKAWFHRF